MHLFRPLTKNSVQPTIFIAVNKALIEALVVNLGLELRACPDQLQIEGHDEAKCHSQQNPNKCADESGRHDLSHNNRQKKLVYTSYKYCGCIFHYLAQFFSSNKYHYYFNEIHPSDLLSPMKNKVYLFIFI